MKLILSALLVAAFASNVQAEEYKNTTLSDAQVALVKKMVSEKLKDPDSAKFPTEFYAAVNVADKNDISVCGKVNGKNSYGAYAGATPFYAKLTAPWSGSKDPNYPLLAMIGGDFEPAVIVEMCKQNGVSYF